jgi:hypothetical protein
MHLKGAPIEAPYSSFAYPKFATGENIDNRIWCQNILARIMSSKERPTWPIRAKEDIHPSDMLFPENQ